MRVGSTYLVQAYKPPVRLPPPLQTKILATPLGSFQTYNDRVFNLHLQTYRPRHTPYTNAVCCQTDRQDDAKVYDLRTPQVNFIPDVSTRSESSGQRRTFQRSAGHEGMQSDTAVVMRSSATAMYWRQHTTTITIFTARCYA